jgi:predicted amidohydrolase
MVRVAAVQVETDAVESVPDRIDRVVAAVDDIAAGGAGGIDVCAADELELGVRPDLIVLPELWTVGAFDMPTLRAHTETLTGATVEQFTALARARATWIHLGALPIVGDDGTLRNTSVVVSPGGEVATYAKRHLFGFDSGEAELFAAGAEQVVMTTPLGATGLSTCYDLRFPELYRSLVDLGATAFLIPAGWPERRIDHWRTLLRARAIENQAWTVAVNGIGVHAGLQLGGCSAVIDPWGQLVVEAPADRECVVLADLDPDAAGITRSAFPVLRDRVM